MNGQNDVLITFTIPIIIDLNQIREFFKTQVNQFSLNKAKLSLTSLCIK